MEVKQCHPDESNEDEQQFLTFGNFLVKVDNVTVLSHPQAEYNSEGTIIKPAGMYLLNVQDIPTFISIKPMPFVKGSSVEFKELMIYIKDNFQFAPKTLEKWESFAAKYPKNDDADDFVAQHGMYIPLKEVLFGGLSIDLGNYNYDYNADTNNSVQVSSMVTTDHVSWSNRGIPTVRIAPRRYCDETVEDAQRRSAITEAGKTAKRKQKRALKTTSRPSTTIQQSNSAELQHSTSISSSIQQSNSAEFQHSTQTRSNNQVFITTQIPKKHMDQKKRKNSCDFDDDDNSVQFSDKHDDDSSKGTEIDENWPFKSQYNHMPIETDNKESDWKSVVKNGQIKLFGQSFLYKGKAFSVNSGKIGQQIFGDLEKGRVVDVVRKGESSEYFFKYYDAGVHRKPPNTNSTQWMYISCKELMKTGAPIKWIDKLFGFGLINRIIRKSFKIKNGKKVISMNDYWGTILSYSEISKEYTVQFEDGDKLNFLEVDVVKCLR